MTLDPRLSNALSDRYRLERELGSGGMATVYLAEDLKLHRKVAVKVLRPELGATLGPERFTREIEVAARLQHPHILGVLDAGDKDGFFYYAMPYVEGETLRDRLARSGELPVHEAVRLLGEVAEALSVAHAAGIVHRDIKPENIILSGRHAMVMDFGVAKAVTEASGRQQLTTAGVALGTPAYMAPEQASADPHMDGRVDIYAIGVMAYEMLSGQTPFHGLNPQQTLAAHVMTEPRPLSQVRSGLSPALESVVMRCLAKRPADRFQTAADLASALEPLATPSGGMTPTGTQPVKAAAGKTGATGRSGRIALASGGLLILAIGLFVWKPWARNGSKALDPNLVAVLPFRVAGADPSVQYLRQGMVDLLQTKLTGQGGPRAADARSVLAAVRDAGGDETHDIPDNGLADVARKIGAGRVLQGSIVGPADHLVISASLLAMPGARNVAEASVTGPKDSLFVLIDRLTAQLLALGAGASSAQLSSLTTTNLDALRAYLDGVSAFRRGAFASATSLLSHAVDLDSTFALALSALSEADGWSAGSGDIRRVRQLAWQNRGRLNPQDQLLLSLRLGRRFPSVTPFTERIEDDEKAVQRMPESAQVWYSLGDDLFHMGAIADRPESQVRARQALEQAFQRDSLFGGVAQHLARLTKLEGDTAAQRLWTQRMIALDSVPADVVDARWDLLEVRHDGAGIQRMVAAFDSTGYGIPQGILFWGTLDSAVIANQPALLAAMHKGAVAPGDRVENAIDQMATWTNRGRPAQGRQWLDTLYTLNPGLASVEALISVWFGLGTPDSTRLHPDQIEIDRLRRGDLAAGQRQLDKWKSEAAKDTLNGLVQRLALLTAARLAVMKNDPAAPRLLDVADSAVAGYDGAAAWSALELTQLYMKEGRMDRALRAVRRRWLPMGEPSMPGLGQSMRLEGRLAALTGDKVGAIRAYRNYLRMMADPEPSMIPQRDSVRRELAAVGDLEKK